jgi:hypothetical protein
VDELFEFEFEFDVEVDPEPADPALAVPLDPEDAVDP